MLSEKYIYISISFCFLIHLNRKKTGKGLFKLLNLPRPFSPSAEAQTQAGESSRGAAGRRALGKGSEAVLVEFLKALKSSSLNGERERSIFLKLGLHREPHSPVTSSNAVPAVIETGVGPAGTGSGDEMCSAPQKPDPLLPLPPVIDCFKNMISLLSLVSQTDPSLVWGVPAQGPTCLATGISHLGCWGC